MFRRLRGADISARPRHKKSAKTQAVLYFYIYLLHTDRLSNLRQETETKK